MVVVVKKMEMYFFQLEKQREENLFLWKTVVHIATIKT